MAGSVATIATVIGMGTDLIGSFVQAKGTLAAGRAQKQALDYEAAQLDAKALEERAAAQREAKQYKRQKDLALSSLQARAAASGFSASDPTANALAGEIAKYGTLQEQTALYGGRSRAAGYNDAAFGRRVSGRAAVRGAGYAAAGTILGGISSMASRYGSYDMARPKVSTGRYGGPPILTGSGLF